MINDSFARECAENCNVMDIYNAVHKTLKISDWQQYHLFQLSRYERKIPVLRERLTFSFFFLKFSDLSWPWLKPIETHV